MEFRLSFLSRRSRLRLYVLALPLAVGVVAFRPQTGAQAGGGEENLGPGKMPLAFPHDKHVPRAWLAKDPATSKPIGGVGRDCLGCHENPADEDKPKAPDVKLAACTECHYGLFEVEDKGRQPLREEMRSFRHQDHMKTKTTLSCNSCHSPRGSQLEPNMKVPGMESCFCCHDPDAEGECDPKMARLRLPAFLHRMNRDDNEDFSPWSFSPDKPGFLHSEHVAWWGQEKNNESRWQDCVPCHEATRRSAGIGQDGSFDLPARIFEVSECKVCHIERPALPGTEFPAVEFKVGTDPSPMKSRTAGTFSHADHFFLEGPPSRETQEDKALSRGRVEISQRGCFTCHEQRGNTYVVQDRFVPGPGQSSYDGCVQACHESWAVEKDLKSEKPWREVSHADLVKDTQQCQGCHELGFVTGMKTNRPQEKAGLEREYAASFSFQSHAHPFISKKPTGLSVVEVKNPTVSKESCGKCHLGKVEELTSRLPTKEFIHATHLPVIDEAKATPEEKARVVAHCEQCHPSIAATKGAAQIDKLSTLFTDKDCATCHFGSTVKATATVPRNLSPAPPVFAHADHVGKPIDGASGRAVNCLDCHPAGLAKGVANIAVREEAKTCKPCHSHDKTPLATGDVSQAYVDKCDKCHKRGVPPARKEPAEAPERAPAIRTELLQAPRQLLTGIVGRQHHPHPIEDSRACKGCHVVLPAAPAPVDLVWGKGYFGGKTINGRGFHQTVDRAPSPVNSTGQKVDCMCCHWGDFQRQSNPRSYVCNEISKGETRADPLVGLVRAALGKLTKDYPGRDCGVCAK
jgi:hypothetical protein